MWETESETDCNETEISTPHTSLLHRVRAVAMTPLCVNIQAIEWYALAARILSFGGVVGSGALHCKGKMQKGAPRRVQQPQCFLLHYEPALSKSARAGQGAN
jgi:hypothetical protein